MDNPRMNPNCTECEHSRHRRTAVASHRSRTPQTSSGDAVVRVMGEREESICEDTFHIMGAQRFVTEQLVWLKTRGQLCFGFSFKNNKNEEKKNKQWENWNFTPTHPSSGSIHVEWPQPKSERKLKSRSKKRNRKTED